MDSRFRGNDSVTQELIPTGIKEYHLKKQTQFAKLTAKGAEQALPNAHMKGLEDNVSNT